MKRFRFPLDRLRHWRRLQQESEQAKLDECVVRLRSVEHMEAELDRRRITEEQSLRGNLAANTVIAAGDTSLWAAHRNQMRRLADSLAAKKNDARLEMERQRSVLLNARRRSEVLNRAHEAAFQNWRRDLDREQEAIAGELYLTHWRPSRNRAGGFRIEAAALAEAAAQAVSPRLFRKTAT